MHIEFWKKTETFMYVKMKKKFLIQMHSQAKTSSTKLPEEHRVGKELIPNLRPEKQYAIPKKGMTERPRIGQGRAGLRRKHEPDCINQPSDVTRRISERSKIVTEKQISHIVQMPCMTEE